MWVSNANHKDYPSHPEREKRQERDPASAALACGVLLLFAPSLLASVAASEPVGAKDALTL